MTMWQGNVRWWYFVAAILSFSNVSSQLLTVFNEGGSMGHGTQNNPWMKLMGIVSHKDRQHNQPGPAGSNDRNLNM